MPPVRLDGYSGGRRARGGHGTINGHCVVDRSRAVIGGALIEAKIPINGVVVPWQEVRETGNDRIGLWSGLLDLQVSYTESDD